MGVLRMKLKSIFNSYNHKQEKLTGKKSS